MPAPRAVLADIHDKGLDPARAWSITDKGGRLTATPKSGAKPAGHQEHMVAPAPAAPAHHLGRNPMPVEQPVQDTPKVEQVVIRRPKPAVQVAPAPVVEAVKPVEEKPTDVKAEETPAEEKPAS